MVAHSNALSTAEDGPHHRGCTVAAHHTRQLEQWYLPSRGTDSTV